MKKGSYSQEKSRGGGGDFHKIQEKQGEISETQITFLWSAEICIFQTSLAFF